MVAALLYGGGCGENPASQRVSAEAGDEDGRRDKTTPEGRPEKRRRRRILRTASDNERNDFKEDDDDDDDDDDEEEEQEEESSHAGREFRCC